MKQSRLLVAMAAVSGFGLSQLGLAETPTESTQEYSDELLIIGIRDNRESSGATGLDLNAYETPQSLTILDAETLDNFALDNINTMLKMTTGVNVVESETDRTYYNARGFDITSMHVDGVGVPFGGLIVGDIDTAIYEKVEVVRGSNGLITGIGNPSGTVNYVRKRPGNELAASTKINTGSWNENRIEVDLTAPITASGSWAARVVGAYQDNDSWLEDYANNRQLGYLMVDGQVTSDITLALSYSRQKNESDGVLWGALPFIYSNGTQAEFDASTSTTQDWTYWDTDSSTSFVELGWQLSDAWNLTTSYTDTQYEESSEIFYVYTNAGVGLDEASGLGLFSYPGKYDDDEKTQILNSTLKGDFYAFGQDHKVNLGLSLADSTTSSMSFDALTGFEAMPSFPGWTGQEVARPNWAAPYKAASGDVQLNRLYGSMLLSATEQLKLILGVNYVSYENEGVSFGVSTDASEDGTNPYIGVTYEVFNGLNIYASYSDIYQPQYVLTEALEPIGSAEGQSYEAGLKAKLNDELMVNIALFNTVQENLEEFARYGDGDGVDDTDFSDDFTYAMYRGINVDATGLEMEVVGNITEQVSIQAGFTTIDMKDNDGNEMRTFIPRNTLKMLAAWSPVAANNLDLGLSLRSQDDIYFDTEFGRISQEAYTLIGGYVQYDIDPSLTLALNVNNLTDVEYLSSVKYEQSFYAAPLSYEFSLSWSY